MNGERAAPSVKTISRLNSSRKTMIGVSHHFLLWRMKSHSSASRAILDIVPVSLPKRRARSSRFLPETTVKPAEQATVIPEDPVPSVPHPANCGESLFPAPGFFDQLDGP